MTLTERDERLIRTLLGKIRIVSFEQLARTWWPDSESSRTNAKRRVRELLESKLLVRERAFARPLLVLEKPLFTWKPGKDCPDYEKLSYQLQSRWIEEPQPMSVYLVSTRAANIFGGTASGRIKNPSQVTHDLHLAEMYLRLLKDEPELAECWAGEAIIAPSREYQKLPDAILLDKQGKPRLVMEFGGAYPAYRVQAFHEDCQARSLAYEMW
jgi:hypothetical protein